MSMPMDRQRRYYLRHDLGWDIPHERAVSGARERAEQDEARRVAGSCLCGCPRLAHPHARACGICGVGRCPAYMEAGT